MTMRPPAGSPASASRARAIMEGESEGYGREKMFGYPRHSMNIWRSILRLPMTFLCKPLPV